MCHWSLNMHTRNLLFAQAQTYLAASYAQTHVRRTRLSLSLSPARSFSMPVDGFAFLCAQAKATPSSSPSPYICTKQMCCCCCTHVYNLIIYMYICTVHVCIFLLYAISATQPHTPTTKKNSKNCTSPRISLVFYTWECLELEIK